MFGLTEDDDLEEYLRQKAEQPYQLDAGISDPAEAAAQSGGPAAGRDPYQEYLQMRQLMPRGQGATQLPEQDNTGALGAAGGAILDMVLNKGRGVGQIAAATAGNLSEQTNKRRQMEFELARQNATKDPFQEYLAYANLAARQDDIANRGTNTAIRGNLLDPNSAQAQGQIQQAAAKAGATKGAALDATHVRADDIAEDAGLRSEQTALGRERADASFADAKRGRDVERAKEIAQAVGPVQTQNAVSRETALNPVRAEGAAERVTATAGPSAAAAADRQQALRDDAADPDALKQREAIATAGRDPEIAKNRDQNQINQFNEKNKDVMEVLRATQDLDKLILDKDGKLKPNLPIGPVDSRLADAKEYLGLTSPEDAGIASNLATARSAITKYYTGLASTSAQDKQFAKIAADPHSSDARFFEAYSKIKESMNARLAESATGREDLVAPVLKNGGINARAPTAQPSDDSAEPDNFMQDDGTIGGTEPTMMANPDGTYDIYEPGHKPREGVRLKFPLSTYTSQGFKVLQ